MARKGRMLRTMLMLGGAAAAGYAIYKNRELLKTFFEELTAAPETRDYEGTVIEFEPAAEPENDIVIDRTGMEPERSAGEG